MFLGRKINYGYRNVNKQKSFACKEGQEVATERNLKGAFPNWSVATPKSGLELF